MLACTQRCTIRSALQALTPSFKKRVTWVISDRSERSLPLQLEAEKLLRGGASQCAILP